MMGGWSNELNEFLITLNIIDEDISIFHIGNEYESTFFNLIFIVINEQI